MQISLRWLKELVNLETISVETLITKLTLGGFEVEEVLEVELGNETTLALDISSTANRSDSLSIQGLSLEIAALLNHNPSQLAYSTKTYPWSQEFESLISNDPIQTNCSGFISLVIENLSSFKSPKWLQQKLISCGLPVENNLTDFQNYILIFREQKIYALRKTKNQKFYPSGVGSADPTLLNLPDRIGGFLSTALWNTNKKKLIFGQKRHSL